jgi:hypothetical protein
MRQRVAGDHHIRLARRLDEILPAFPLRPMM